MTASRRTCFLTAIVVVIALAVGVSSAYWSAGSNPGGSGAAAAAAVNQGATPTASAVGDTVTVSWAASTLSNGGQVAGYLVNRYDAATAVVQTIRTACTGTLVATTCTENTVPSGQWVYAVTPVLGTHWSGAESAMSNAVTTTNDATPPTNAVSMSLVTGNAVQNGDTIFYRGAASGSFTLANAVSDSGSGPASSATSGLSGDSTGWTHAPSTVSTPVGGPYVSASFSWTAGTTSAPTEVVTGRDVGGNSAATTLSLVNDSTAPSAGTVSYTDGYQPGQSVIVTVASGTDSGSGIATRQLQRSSATIAAGTCGTFTSFANVGPEGPSSPYTDADVLDAHCYQYRYVVTDQVGNQDIATSANVAKVFGGPALGSAASFSVLGGTGVVNTGTTSVSGDVGASPSTSVTGFEAPSSVGGDIHAGDSVAATAQSDLVAAYNDAAGRVPTASLPGDLIGLTLHPGVYHSAAAVGLTGTLTLDGDGDPNAVFIFQVGAAFGPAASSTVLLTNGAQASHVFWQINGAVTIGASASFAGTIMASGAVTIGNLAQLIGRAMSYGTITMANNTVRFTTALPPTVTITGGAAVVTKDTTPTIAGTTNAPTGAPVTVKVGGQTLTTTAQTGGSWSVTAAALSAGTYSAAVSVRDSAGNAGSATQSITVEVNPDPVPLGAAATYSVLAATTVANTGTTNLSGDLGVKSGGTISGFPPGIVAGDVHAGDTAASQAESDLALAYSNAAGRTPSAAIPADLTAPLHAGVYHSSAAFSLTQAMTLDGEGNPNAVFIFQVDAAVTATAAGSVTLTNSASAANVFWQVNGAVTAAAASSFVGTVMATGAISYGAGSLLVGRALSLANVALDSDTVRFTTALPPTVTIVNGATFTTKDTTPTITGTTNAPTGAPVTVKVGGQTLTTTAQTDGSWSVTAAALTAGSYPLVASARDSAGNWGSATQSLTVEVNPNPVVLGTAATYSVLAGTGVTSTGTTSLSGDLGSSTINTISGFTPGRVGGTIHNGDTAAAQAQTDRATAYNEAAGRAPSGSLPANPGGTSLHAGIYQSTAAVALTGTLTLDGEGNANAVFILQVPAALSTAAGSTVRLINGAQAANVFWQVNGAVGTGAPSTFVGTIMAAGAVTLGDGTLVTGSVLSEGTVTLANDTVAFSTGTPPTVTIDGGATATAANSTPTITGTTTAAIGTSVTVRVDAQVLITTVQSDGSWSVQASTLAAGTHDVVASARDSAGNAGFGVQALTV